MKLATVLVALFFLWIFGLLPLALSIACVVLSACGLGILALGLAAVVTAPARVALFIAREIVKCSKKY